MVFGLFGGHSLRHGLCIFAVASSCCKTCVTVDFMEAAIMLLARFITLNLTQASLWLLVRPACALNS